MSTKGEDDSHISVPKAVVVARGHQMGAVEEELLVPIFFQEKKSFAPAGGGSRFIRRRMREESKD